MNSRRSRSRGDGFTVFAFFTLGAIIAFAASSIYFVVTYGSQASALRAQAKNAVSDRDKHKAQLSANATKFSTTLARQTILHEQTKKRETALQQQLADMRERLESLERQIASAGSPETDAIAAPEGQADPTMDVVEAFGADSDGPDSPAPNGAEPVVATTVSIREWHSRVGDSSILAKLLDCDLERKTATLLKADGTVIEVQFENLSLDDVAHCIAASEANDLGLNDLDQATLSSLQAITQKSLTTINLSLKNCADRLITAYKSDGTSVQKNREYTLAGGEFLTAIKGLRMQVHFLVEDVESARQIGPDRSEVRLALTAPDVPLQAADLKAYTRNVEVVTSTNLAESMNKGSVVRVIGRINEPSRKAFTSLRLHYELPEVPRGIAYALGSSFRAAGSERTHVTLVLHVEHMRKLNQQEADAYIKAQQSMQIGE